MNAVIGIDYGTKSARAILVDAATGDVLKSISVKYPRGILTNDTVCVDDYTETLDVLLCEMAIPEYRESVRGICVDATSLTLVCLTKEGVPLEKVCGFEETEHAKVKLWKRHTAKAQAEEALALAKSLDEPFLQGSCGTISAEWTLPKLLEMRDEAPKVYARADIAFDLCEYLTYLLTGRLVRTIGSMCYKGLWSKKNGFPSDNYLDTLREGFAKEYKHLLRGEVLTAGSAAGTLLPDICSKYGFPQDTVVAVGTVDGHTSQVALGATDTGDATLVIGTSNVLTVQTDRFYNIDGLCGVAEDGQIEGLCGIDAGQACTGEMLEWFVGKTADTDVHAEICSRIKEPWSNKVIAVDWWNGSRNVPYDLSLSGGIYGLTLTTKTEDVYLALLQAIVCGTRAIIERCEESGVAVNKVFAAGGVALKNPLLMQEYASILNKPVYVGHFSEGPALGSAIFAAVASGLYEDVREAYAKMGNTEFTVYNPDTEHRAEYETLYKRNCKIRKIIAKAEV